jgi:hypothetical protein
VFNRSVKRACKELATLDGELLNKMTSADTPTDKSSRTLVHTILTIASMQRILFL